MYTETSQKQHPENKEDQPVCPDELIKTHAADPSHIITDEQINNLRTGEECEKASELEHKIEDKADELKDQTPEDELPNPYTVLGS